MSSQEHRALLLLLALAVAGHVVRRLATRPGEAPGQVELVRTLPPGSPAAQRDSALRLARPLGPGERIDADRASAAELARLPRVGPTLAKTIVADRDANGPFGSLQGLDRVAGVGPGLLKVVGQYLSFSASQAVTQGGQAVSRWGGQFARAPNQPLAASSDRPTAWPPDRLDLNSASIAQLDSLPGIGPTRAQAIVAHREAHGPFGSLEEVARVPGLGPAAVARLRDRVVVR